MDTMRRLESAIQRLEATVKQQAELHKFTYEALKLINKRLTRVEGLNSQTAEDLIKLNGLTDPLSRDTSITNPTFIFSLAD